MSISSLGYVVVEASDLKTWADYAQNILGAESNAVADALELRVDDRAWRIRVEQGPLDDLKSIGFETLNAAAFADVLARLDGEGVEYTLDAELAKARGVVELARFTDPSGVSIEVFYGPTRIFQKPFVSPVGMQGFLTGEQGLGHIVIAVKDDVEYQAFWSKLGFRLSDYIEFEPMPGFQSKVTFMHCNPRHHTLAFAAVPSPKKIIHLMLQAQRLDDVGLALDRAKKSGVPVAWDLGRHTNDHMTSFYMLTPSKWEIEYGWGAREIDDATWTVERHDSMSIWGHELKIKPEDRLNG
ncbi:VOC family protein [Xanthomonas euvesicatoria]|uniref:VOC family protein n=1 Tax=Xanthomonas citri TaxID=346 RepID=UPI000F800929|nr:VOC family protein [Xanthomonas axonopodis]MEE5092096.1 VOC family protein [Xanthomonas euvesicatoria]RTE55726.1 2,3-dihydroxybiphenyl 1,2-dioxygenase [Xanthomonas axonopodis pv. eucalyptorum]